MGEVINVSVEINRDIDKFQESVVLGLTAKQLIASVLSILIGGVIVLHALQQGGKTTGMAGLCRSGW